MTTVNLGTVELATACTILAPSLAMPPRSYWRPTMKPVMFCRNTSGTARALHSSMKCVALSADSENSTPLLATMPDQEAVQPGETGDDGGRVEALELVEA
jgi:hypothetical protein